MGGGAGQMNLKPNQNLLEIIDRWPVSQVVSLVLGEGAQALPVLARQAQWLEG